MSDTPRMDASAHDDGAIWQTGCDIELELNAANGKIELLMSANADVARIAGERDEAEKRIKRLEAVTNDPHALWTNWLRGDVKLPVGIGDVRQYQERIKRLEELGNELRECARQLGWTSSDDSRWIERAEAAVEAWDKEAKL